MPKKNKTSKNIQNLKILTYININYKYINNKMN